MTNGCSALGEKNRRFRGPRQKSHYRETEQQTRGLNKDCYVSVNSANVQEMPYVRKKNFFLIGIGICYFQNKPFCTFQQNVATLDCLVRSSYPQLHGIVNLVQILQRGLESVLEISKYWVSTRFYYKKSLKNRQGRLC